MPLPYRIEICDGPRVDVTRDRAPPDWPRGVPWKRPAEREYVTNPVAVKVYPDGQRVEATAEEAAVWGHVQILEERLSAHERQNEVADREWREQERERVKRHEVKQKKGPGAAN